LYSCTNARHALLVIVFRTPLAKHGSVTRRAYPVNVPGKPCAPSICLVRLNLRNVESRSVVSGVIFPPELRLERGITAPVGDIKNEGLIPCVRF
jgi:hypothetical protein